MLYRSCDFEFKKNRKNKFSLNNEEEVECHGKDIHKEHATQNNQKVGFV